MKSHIQQIHKVIEQRKILKNNELMKTLTDQGSYDQAVRLQKPTVEAIVDIRKELSKELSKELVEVKKAVENKNTPFLSDRVPLEKPSSTNNDYVLSKTDNTSVLEGNEYSIWRIGKSEIDFVLVLDRGLEFIQNITIRKTLPSRLTEGLKEILFNNG